MRKIFNIVSKCIVQGTTLPAGKADVLFNIASVSATYLIVTSSTHSVIHLRPFYQISYLASYKNWFLYHARCIACPNWRPPSSVSHKRTNKRIQENSYNKNNSFLMSINIQAFSQEKDDWRPIINIAICLRHRCFK